MKKKKTIGQERTNSAGNKKCFNAGYVTSSGKDVVGGELEIKLLKISIKLVKWEKHVLAWKERVGRRKLGGAGRASRGGGKRSYFPRKITPKFKNPDH